jgi:hypothetical protein
MTREDQDKRQSNLAQHSTHFFLLDQRFSQPAVSTKPGEVHGPFVVVINGQTLVGSGYSGSDQAPLTLTGSVTGNLVTGEVFENVIMVADFTGTVGANGKFLGSFTTVIGLGGGTGSFNACRTTS